MSARGPSRWRTGAAIVAIVLGLSALLRPHWLSAPLLQDLLARAAEARVDASLARNSVSFLTLSGLKSVLASIEGSSVGVGFQLELGDLVQPVYDYLDFVWYAFLYALALLGFYKLLMQTGILALGLSLAGAGLLLWGAGALARSRLPALCGLGGRAVALGLAAGYALPLALLASQSLSQRYLEPLRQRSAQRIEEAGAPLEEAAARLRALREHLSLLEPGKSLEAIQREARQVAAQVSDALWERMQAFFAYVLILGVELLLLPFLSAWLILKALGASGRALRPARGPAGAALPGAGPYQR